MLLVGDNLALDFVVSGLRDDLACDEIGLGLVRPPIDNLFRKSWTDPRQRVKFVGAGAVDINERAFLCRRGRRRCGLL
jgi:hypothetical protein